VVAVEVELVIPFLVFSVAMEAPKAVALVEGERLVKLEAVEVLGATAAGALLEVVEVVTEAEEGRVQNAERHDEYGIRHEPASLHVCEMRRFSRLSRLGRLLRLSRLLVL
jgi:hypothetical protein